MDEVDVNRASRVSFDAHARSLSGSFSGPPGARLSKDGWFTGPGGASSSEVLNALRLESYAHNETAGTNGGAGSGEKKENGDRGSDSGDLDLNDLNAF